MVLGLLKIRMLYIQSKYKVIGKIYDCVPFFNELEVLEIRLDIMYDYVDFFYNK
jgi:hypothetical protein